MAKKGSAGKYASKGYAEDVEAIEAQLTARAARPSSLIDTRVIYCGDCLEQLRKLPEKCIDLIYIDPRYAGCTRMKST